MYPDFSSLVNDFIRPVVSVFLFAFMILGWIIAYQLMKEVTNLKIRLGIETQQEEFKYWFLRKSATIILPLYSLKTKVENQFQLTLNHLLKKRKKALKLAFRLNSIVSIILSVFQIIPAGTNSEVRK